MLGIDEVYAVGGPAAIGMFADPPVDRLGRTVGAVRLQFAGRRRP